MPTLSSVPDETLLDEVGVLIGAGWRIIDRPSSRHGIRHLLSLAAPKPHEMFATVARRLLEMINEVLERSTDFDGIGDEQSELLNEEQSQALRILFGLHPDYRWASVTLRRTEAGALLLGRDSVKANTFYKSYENDAKRMALECLRARYGQGTDRPSRSYESVRRCALVTVGDNRRISSVKLDNVYRSLSDGLDYVRNWFQLENPDDLEAITIDRLTGVISYDLERRQSCAYRITFSLPRSFDTGDEIVWGYQRSYHYRQYSPIPDEDRIGISGRNDDFEFRIAVQFLGPLPAAIWRYSRRKTMFAVEPAPETIVVPDTNRVVTHESTNSSALRVYGVAWRWETR